MPTYTISTAMKLTDLQRKRIVESITSIHNVEAKAPRFFVQVIFYKVEAGAHFRDGEAVSADAVWIRADIRAGRTKEQKACILHRLMEELSDILQISQRGVWVQISDIPAENIAELGAILPPPGGEEKWLETLPDDMRQKLQAR